MNTKKPFKMFINNRKMFVFKQYCNVRVVEQLALLYCYIDFYHNNYDYKLVILKAQVKVPRYL